MCTERLKDAYKAFRSLLFSAIIVVGLLFFTFYVLLSIPAIQRQIAQVATRELTEFLGGEVQIGDISIFPFNEVVLEDVSLLTPQGEECINISRVGAGISLWSLLIERKIVITYAEIIGLDSKIWKTSPDSPLNIQFLIDAFAPKDKNKPPTRFDLKVHNVVIRRSTISYDNRWIQPKDSPYQFDPNHILIERFNADILLPRLSNEDFRFDVRRISLRLGGTFELNSLRFKGELTDKQLTLNDFRLELPHTLITLNDQQQKFSSLSELKQQLLNTPRKLELKDARINPSDFSIFLPALKDINQEITLNLYAYGSPDNIESFDMVLSPQGDDSSISLTGSGSNLLDRGNMAIAIDKFHAILKNSLSRKVADIIPANYKNVVDKVTALGDIDISLSAKLSQASGNIDGILSLLTSCGKMETEVSMNVPQLREFKFNRFNAKGLLLAENLQIADIFEKSPASDLTARAEFNVEMGGKLPSGLLNCEIENVVANGHQLQNIVASLEKTGDEINLNLDSDNPALGLHLEGAAALRENLSDINLSANVDNIDFGLFSTSPKMRESSVGGSVELELSDLNPATVCGSGKISNLKYAERNRSLKLNNFDFALQENPDSAGGRLIDIESDWFNLAAEVDCPIKSVVPNIIRIVRKGVPLMARFIPEPQFIPEQNKVANPSKGNINGTLTLKPVEAPYKFFNVGITPLVESSVSASFDFTDETLNLNANFPYLKQGKNKLIRETALATLIDGRDETCNVSLHTLYPTKKGDAEVDLNLIGFDDKLKTDIDFNKSSQSGFYGTLGLETFLTRDPSSGKDRVHLNVKPSRFMLNGAEWNVSPAAIEYSNGVLAIDRLNINHDDQFIDIRGVGSSSVKDEVVVKLAGIDLDYIFDTLNINYVTFGGEATGEVMAAAIFSGSPVLQTRGLHVKNLSYNGGVLGDGDLSSSFDIKEKKVNIMADIKEKGQRKAFVDGGIWVTRDSLSFSLQADKVDIEFLKPFMASFTSDVSGRASGNAKLYGTFSDIDLVGRLFADTIRMRVDYTNVVYAGSDSVIMTPGKIEIPHIRLYDRDGHSGVFSGIVRHRYFHEPSFEFNLRDADNLLCYDTNSAMNEMWYGTVYGTGGGRIRGDNSLVAIDIDMTTRSNSDFTFVLTDTQEASEYKFLNFTDRRKEHQKQQAVEDEPDFLSQFHRQIQEDDGSETEILMDIRASITPQATLNIVMDPVAGDKIRANGSGAMQIEYDSGTDDMRMYGKFTLDQGHYNFSLQDIILKDFSIKPGSTISFNGDPLDGILDIAATYRVNTNLSDLDKSFSTDRDLNRTNVPVDAVLLVNGPMTSPAISFDIDLPTLTDEVERKVRSIISTDDQMSRQILYLLALNRFYTPEYMGGSSNGGEWASVASSTISSQITNVLGQLTDKVSVMPSFRSDKGDFSDMEVDLALSSKLLNNRLLLNGNFGYRDKSTSTTTFIGDFDIEYVLTRNGALRLKAYNHFNDENYYLKSSLTTQGVGIVVRKEFDSLNLRKLFRRKEKGKTDPRKRKSKVKNP